MDSSNEPMPQSPAPMETHGNRDAGAGNLDSAGTEQQLASTRGTAIRDFFLWCAIPVAIVVLLRIFVFGMYVIPSRSMENTIMPGDRVITTKLSPRPVALKRGDIVVFKDPRARRPPITATT